MRVVAASSANFWKLGPTVSMLGSPGPKQCQVEHMKESVVVVVTATLNALKERGALKLEAGVPAFNVDPPKNAAHGDFSCNVAMVIAKGEGKAPLAIAELLV